MTKVLTVDNSYLSMVEFTLHLSEFFTFNITTYYMGFISSHEPLGTNHLIFVGVVIRCCEPGNFCLITG